MRTMTVDTQREIAVHTEESKSFFGKAMFFEPRIESGSSAVRSMFATPTVDMVDCQKLEMRLGAALTLPSVGGDHTRLEVTVILLEVLLATGVSLLFHQNHLSIFFITLSLVGTFGLLVGSVSVSSVLFYLFLVERVVFRPLHAEENTSVLKECQHGQCNGYWNKYPTGTTRQYRQLVVGGSRQQCRDEKFSLIDLDAEMQTRRKAEVCHRDRLSERTSLADGAIVGSCGNWNRKRTAEMSVPCFA